MKTHDMILCGDMYENVWLHCSCGVRIELGRNCSPEYALEVANEHKETAQGIVKISKSY